MKLQRIFPKASALRCSLLALGASMAAAPAATLFTDSSSFIGSLQAGYYTETFSPFNPPGGDADLGVTSLSFSGNGFDYSIEADQNLYGIGDDPGPRGLSVTSASDMRVVINVSEQVTAIGGRFSTTDALETLLSESFQITLSDGTTHTLTTSGTTPYDFVGFTTTPGTFITQLTLGQPLSTFQTINELTVGYAAVPEPAVVASVTGVGLLGLGMVLRRAPARRA